MALVLDRHSDAGKWAGSRLEKIRRVPNTKVGDAGQDYVEEVCKLYGFGTKFPGEADSGKRSRQSSWDIQIDGIKFELKCATEDVAGAFQFNHIRYAREYEALMCLGVGPENIYFNIWSKADVATGKAGKLVSMEKSGSASYKLTKRQDGLKPIQQFEAEMRYFISNFKP